MKRLFLLAASCAVIASAAIAQDSTPMPPQDAPTQTDPMPPMDDVPPADPAPMPGDMPMPAPGTDPNAMPMPRPMPAPMPMPAPGEPGADMGQMDNMSAQAAPMAATAPYPLCTKTLQDSCRNPGEGVSAKKPVAKKRR
jgi:hypothetical protein